MAEHESLQPQGPGPRTGLYRPREDRMIAGVCAGIARYFGWSTNRVRIVYTIVAALSAAFPGIAVYLVLWLIMPGDPRGPRSFRVE